MTEWLIASQAQVQSWLWLGSFGLVAVWESFGPRRPHTSGTATAARWFNNITLTALGALLVQVCLPFAAFAFATLAQQKGWGILNRVHLPLWLSCALAVLIMDLGAYCIHRLFHAVPALWRCHKVHHSELEVDCSTAIRHHPLEFLLVAAANLALIAVIGAPPLAILIATVLGAVAAVFNHGNVAIAPPLEHILRRIVVTPDLHRVHHSVVPVESNRNFANLFPWWDHLFSTYQSQPRVAHETMELGLSEARAAKDVTLWKILLLPFRQGGTVPLEGARTARR